MGLLPCSPIIIILILPALKQPLGTRLDELQYPLQHPKGKMAIKKVFASNENTACATQCP